MKEETTAEENVEDIDSASKDTSKKDSKESSKEN